MFDIGWKDQNIGWIKKRKLSCRAIGEQFKIGKTQAAFQAKAFKHLKRENHQRFKAINEILYTWYRKCEASGIYVNVPLLKEEWT